MENSVKKSVRANTRTDTGIQAYTITRPFSKQCADATNSKLWSNYYYQLEGE